MKNIAIVILSTLLLVGCEKHFVPHLEKARKSFAEKNYIDTIDALNAGIPAWKGSDGDEAKGEAYELLGKSYHQLRNTDRAIETYLQAVKFSNKTFDSAYALGSLYMAQSQPEVANKYFSMALRMKPNDPQSLLGMGNSYYAMKKIPEAKEYYEKVLDNSPGVREAIEGLHILQRKKRSR